MGVIIDEFEVILDSEQDRDAEKRATDAEAASTGSALKPHDIATVFEQQALRFERVRAH